MSSSYSQPNAARVRLVLSGLFEGLIVKPGGELEGFRNGFGEWAGVYVNENGHPVAVCRADAALAAVFGAALSRLPANDAKEAARNRQLTSVMTENLLQVMNICSCLFMDSAPLHLTLKQVCAVDSMSPAAQAVVGSGSSRVAFQIDVPKYGGGQLTLVCAI